MRCACARWHVFIPAQVEMSKDAEAQQQVCRDTVQEAVQRNNK
jgi:hypothetical protein